MIIGIKLYSFCQRESPETPLFYRETLPTLHTVDDDE